MHDLGAGYCQVLRDGWVSYLNEKNAASGGQTHRRVDAGSAQKRVVDDEDV